MILINGIVCIMNINLKLGADLMKDLPRFSYSSLNTFIQCPMRYKLKYIDDNKSATEALHLELGNILHKTLETKYRNVIDGKSTNYNELIHILENGIAEDTGKDKGRFLNGLKQLREKYGNELFEEVDVKSGLSYNDKLETFLEYMKSDVGTDEWKPIAVEQPFEFVFEDKAIFHGFIDRIDQNKNGDLRVVDYKSSNKLFNDKDLITPLQMVIYALACKTIYNKIPVEYQYDMILLGEKQYVVSKGFLERGIKKIQKILDDMEWCLAIDEWIPKPSPLCYWCEFSETNPNTEWYTKGLCEYYCLWTPDARTFKRNKEYM